MINELKTDLTQVSGGYCFCWCCPPTQNPLGFTYEIFVGLKDQLQNCVTECANKEGYVFSNCYSHHIQRSEVPILCFNNLNLTYFLKDRLTS
ncbi:hypothetical protein GAMM_170101 [Gammaproteobacteria bacterium]